MFDYVIVGAGSAGCVLAARLTEDPDVSVLLIEAGPPDTSDEHPRPARLRAAVRTATGLGLLDLARAALRTAGAIYLPRGKTLGGSSSINAMVYIRGTAPTTTTGATAAARAGATRICCPTSSVPRTTSAAPSEYHGAGGPLAVSDGRSRNPMPRPSWRPPTRPGSGATTDFNGAEQDGFGRYQVTQRDGRRCSTAVGYLHPAMDRPNLTVETFLQVHRVLFEGDRAVGVQAERLGELHEYRAEREVILCGGAYNSPQLLMLSGIGPGRAADDAADPGRGRSAGGRGEPAGPPRRRLVVEHDEPVSLLAAMNDENMGCSPARGRVRSPPTGSRPAASCAAGAAARAGPAVPLLPRPVRGGTARPPPTASPPRCACSPRAAADTYCTPAPTR